MNEQTLEHHADKDRTYHAVIAGEYEQVVNVPRAFANDLLFRPIDRMLPASGAAMLDLGCGTGQILRRYGGRFEQATGVDHSAEMLVVAEQSLDQAQLAKTRLLRFDLLEFLATEPAQYDLVSMVGCLHHLHPEVLHQVIQQATKRLAPGGRMLLAEPLLQDNMQPPGAIRRWNQKAMACLPKYSSLAEEPDEAPIDETRMKAAIKNAGLHIMVESRGWEMFPRHLPASLFDRIGMWALHRRYGASGYVCAMLLQGQHD